MFGFETRDVQMAQLFRSFSVDGSVGSGSKKTMGGFQGESWRFERRKVEEKEWIWEYYAILPILDLHVFLIDLC